MHFLLTNDDGIHAAGISALREAAMLLPGARVTVVAPATEQSMCGHRVTTHGPLHVEDLGGDRYAVQGTPADCVRIALFGLGLKPDFILSGINQGGNLGQDIVISGTVAATREAAYHGLRAAAFSHYMVKGLPVDWSRTARWAAEVLSELITQPLGDGEFWNVNFPHLAADAQSLPDVVATRPARSPLNVEFAKAEPQDTPQRTEYLYTASYAARPQDPGSDVAACFAGKVSVGKLSVQLI